MTTSTLTLDDLMQDALAEFRAWLDEYDRANPAEDEADEKIRELTDDPCPGATTAALMLAVEDNWLAAAEPDNPAHEATAVAHIRANVADHIAEALRMEWDSIQHDRELAA